PLPTPAQLKCSAPARRSTLSLHDALPIYERADHAQTVGSAIEGDPWLVVDDFRGQAGQHRRRQVGQVRDDEIGAAGPETGQQVADRKSTRLNSSHQIISYAVFCLKKKKRQ